MYFINLITKSRIYSLVLYRIGRTLIQSFINSDSSSAFCDISQLILLFRRKGSSGSIQNSLIGMGMSSSFQGSNSGIQSIRDRISLFLGVVIRKIYIFLSNAHIFPLSSVCSYILFELASTSCTNEVHITRLRIYDLFQSVNIVYTTLNSHYVTQGRDSLSDLLIRLGLIIILSQINVGINIRQFTKLLGAITDLNLSLTIGGKFYTKETFADDSAFGSPFSSCLRNV